MLIIYLTLTVAEIILLSAGGMDLFDSICHSFGTVATGGFSTKNDSIAGYSAYIQYVIALFMFLAATSYVVFYYIVQREASAPSLPMRSSGFTSFLQLPPWLW